MNDPASRILQHPSRTARLRSRQGHWRRRAPKGLDYEDGVGPDGVVQGLSPAPSNLTARATQMGIVVGTAVPSKWTSSRARAISIVQNWLASLR